MLKWREKVPEYQRQFDSLLARGIEREKLVQGVDLQNSNICESGHDQDDVQDVWSWAGPLATEIVSRKNEFDQNWDTTSCKFLLMKLLCVVVESR